jgi:hypothetical protein
MCSIPDNELNLEELLVCILNAICIVIIENNYELYLKYDIGDIIVSNDM